MVRSATLYPAISLFLLLSAQLCAQIRLTYPVDRQVIQRDNNNQASVQLAGSYSAPIDRVEGRFVPIKGGQATDWTTLQTAPTNGQFTGSLTAQGGWYRIEVRGRLGDQIVGNSQLDHFGVGEVFIIFGHSNAQGTTCNNNNDCANTGGSTDERVVSVPINTDYVANPAYLQYLSTANPTYLPALTFSQWSATSGASPFNDNPWIWVRLGDMLVQKLNVPVLFYGVGFGGTNMKQTYLAINNQYFDHGFVNSSIQMPYANLRNVLNLYVPSTGVRGVLVTHGENDRAFAQEDIRTYNREVMKQVRIKSGKDRLAWVLAISSYASARHDNVRNAQYQAIADINNDGSQSKIYLGPDLDPPAGTTGSTAYRPDGVHYSTAGQPYYAQLWADNLTADNNAFFRNSAPYLAEQQPLTGIQCTTNANQLLLSQPAGYSAYSWNTGSTDRQYTGGAGYYSAKLQRSDMSTPDSRDAMRFYFPPAVVVSDDRKIPETPTLTASATVACGNSLTLTSSYAGAAVWNTGATTQAITVASGGTYSAKAKHPIYGCESPAAGTVILPAGTADISLSTQANRRLANVGDTVRLTVNVRNSGPCDVTGIQIQDRLPDNLSLISADPGLVNTGTLVSGTLPLLTSANWLTRSYTVRVTAPGTYVNAVQVTASPVADPDSQPNSGTGDGQDDTAQIDFRTTTAGSSSAVYMSPNPNQAALPAVQSNQPTPSAAKADLSLLAKSGIRVARTGQLATISLTVNNVGGLPATGVGVQATLPTGMIFVSSSSGMTASGSTVQGSIATIPVGGTVTLTFMASVNLAVSATLRVSAEISNADQPDPDSTAGNGNQNKGEDDEATVDIRVLL